MDQPRPKLKTLTSGKKQLFPMEFLPLDRADAVLSVAEVIPDRLYWAAVDIGKFSEILKHEFATHYIKPSIKESVPNGVSFRSVRGLSVSQKENTFMNSSPPKVMKSASSNRVPRVRECTFKVLYTDKVFLYKPLANDFGPVDMSTLHRYIDFVDQASEKSKVIIHVSDHRRPNLCANSAFLIAAYGIIRFNMAPVEVASSFSQVKSELIPPFRDASRSVKSGFPLTLYDFCESIRVSRENGWIDWRTFNVMETERLQLVENGDLNWIIEKKFIAFAGPSSDRIDEDGLDTLPPSHYVVLFKDMGVSDVFRLNVSNYESTEFTKHGINHHDLFFEDGSCPPLEIVNEFLARVARAKGAVAVHCKAGLGRSATMIGLAVMREYRVFAKQYIAWARLARPGSVIGAQQHFLVEMEPIMHGRIPLKVNKLCVKRVGGEKGQGERLLNQKRKNGMIQCEVNKLP